MAALGILPQRASRLADIPSASEVSTEAERTLSVRLVRVRMHCCSPSSTSPPPSTPAEVCAFLSAGQGQAVCSVVVHQLRSLT